ncbi:hypothetical protein CRUP_022243 [Coryphaenoides rupestris]|nr:hypothetical protein CRUP_022243 [Coryphaenoides rupestris]
MATAREQPIFSTRAHVFQIDPSTKKNWVPTSKHAVTVSYFFDSTRNVYRIISLEGSKMCRERGDGSLIGTDSGEHIHAIINSTITPNMTFTKTSQKFGHSTSINKHWEAELAALKGNNAKLTAALLESTANVKQWKLQLAAYQEEAERLHKRKTELNQTIEELEATLRAKEEELERLKEEVEVASEFQVQKESLTQKLQDTEERNQSLEAQLSSLEQSVEASQQEREAHR